MWVPMQDWGFRANSQSGVRYANPYGDSFTPGNNTKGSWVTLFTSGEITTPICGIWINFSSCSTSTAARDMICDIGFDPAGGTSYSVRIPDLLASCAGNHIQGTLDGMGGVNYFFPLVFPSGCSIGVRGSVNNATVGTGRCWAKVYGRPRRPDLLRTGTYCTAVGIVSGSSRGTLVTPGTTGEGAWTTLGTPTKDHWWWQLGFGVNDATMSSLGYHADLSYVDGVPTNRVLIEDEIIITSGAEVVHKPNACCLYEYMAISPANLAIQGRLQCSGTADSNTSMAGYGVGG